MDWRSLRRIARDRVGFFTSSEAAACGVTAQTLGYHVRGGAIERVLRGVYRFTVAPPTAQDELIALWLWSGAVGAFSHATALWLHDLSDAMPARIHLTVPQGSWYTRTTAPKHTVVHVAPLPEAQVGWVDAVPVTTPSRTIADCLAAPTPPETLQQAIREASGRHMISPMEARQFRRALSQKDSGRP